MWPPDPDPDPDPEPAGGSRPGPAVPGLRALLPARAFLCSLKGPGGFVCTWCSCPHQPLW
ncbi:CMTM3 isoform 6 [Pan troglodytes]|uniref:CMTM3 isoform 6 n=4 Tax=Homininae TaxID=207598 RepID=A0A6D2WW65_PANTR|nr:chemokine-like factor super family 3a [Homo sapiens]KAI2578980.1 CKLF like MARVEL transmembrane domain containing 3 [Homo sapiens]KAI4055381.1 CKLF like MARVEL transmembrane domain containing 3 [Homo sapiens]PNI63461.1 CMTM3 isoform 6 [Pan troglodytes]